MSAASTADARASQALPDFRLRRLSAKAARERRPRRCQTQTPPSSGASREPQQPFELIDDGEGCVRCRRRGRACLLFDAASQPGKRLVRLVLVRTFLEGAEEVPPIGDLDAAQRFSLEFFSM